MSGTNVAEPSALTNALLWLTGPMTTALVQRPEPGASWWRRGWAFALRLGGNVLDALPKKTSAPVVLLRIVVALLVWAVVAFVAVYVVLGWATIVVLRTVILVPALYLIHRRQEANIPPPPPPPTLTELAPPLPEPAVDRCAMCGGDTKGAEDRCLFCGSRVPTVAVKGWHTDPLGSGGRRWFDGRTWTEHLQAASRAG